MTRMRERLAIIADSATNMYPMLRTILRDTSFTARYMSSSLILAGIPSTRSSTIPISRDNSLPYDRGLDRVQPRRRSSKRRYIEALRAARTDYDIDIIMFMGSDPSMTKSSFMRDLRTRSRTYSNRVWIVALPGVPRETHLEAAFHTGGQILSITQLSDAGFAVGAIVAHGQSPRALDLFASSCDVSRSRADFINALSKGNSPIESPSAPEIDPSRYQFAPVHNPCTIREFSDGYPIPGVRRSAMFYQARRGFTVSDDKHIILRNKETGDVLDYARAREVIGIPSGASGLLRPRDITDWDIFVRGISDRRKLVSGTRIAYEWGN